jgi:hypothetical protein
MDWHVFILINIFGFVIPLVNEETGKPFCVTTAAVGR